MLFKSRYSRLVQICASSHTAVPAFRLLGHPCVLDTLRANIFRRNLAPEVRRSMRTPCLQCISVNAPKEIVVSIEDMQTFRYVLNLFIRNIIAVYGEEQLWMHAAQPSQCFIMLGFKIYMTQIVSASVSQETGNCRNFIKDLSKGNSVIQPLFFQMKENVVQKSGEGHKHFFWGRSEDFIVNFIVCVPIGMQAVPGRKDQKYTVLPACTAKLR